MRNNFKIALAVAVTSVLQLAVLAQRQIPLTEQQLVAIDNQRMDALRRGDTVPLEKIYADDYTLVTGTGQVRSKADQIAELKSGQLRYASIDSVERQVRLYGDVGVIVSRQKAVIFQNGQQITSGDERVTRVYKKMNDSWRVIATHATPIRCVRTHGCGFFTCTKSMLPFR
jgi:uncharacterized protein (TIGR02246 family)